MQTSGQKCVEAIRAYIAENNTSWSKLNGDIVAAIIDKTLPRSKRSNGAFIPPTPAEVEAYGDSIEYRLDGQDFCDHYEKKDWKVSGTIKMTNWKSAVRQWKSHRWGADLLRRADGSSALTEVRGWRFYLKLRQAEGLFKKSIPETWEQLDQVDKMQIRSRQSYVQDLGEYAERNPAEFSERLKKIEENAA